MKKVAAPRSLLVAMIQLVCVSSSFAMHLPIHDAAIAGKTEVVLQLITEDLANRDAADENGSTPLHVAASKGHIATVQALLARGADVKIKNVDDFTPLHWAAWKGHTEIAQALVDAGATIDAFTKFGKTPLHWAASDGRIETVQALIAHGANVNAANSRGETPIYEAAWKGHTATVQVLLAGGANVKLENENGRTPLQLAQLFECTSTVAALQPAAIAQTHANEALRQIELGSPALAARSHTWAAETYTTIGNHEKAIASHMRAAESYLAAGNHEAARISYKRIIEIQFGLENHSAAASFYISVHEYELAAQSYGELFNSIATRVELTPDDKITNMNEAEAQAVADLETAGVVIEAAFVANNTPEFSTQLRQIHAAIEQVQVGAAASIDAISKRDLKINSNAITGK